VQPLLELVENDQQLLARGEVLAAPECRQRLLEPQVSRQGRALFPQSIQQPRFRLPPGRLDKHRANAFGQPRQQARLDQRRFAAPGWTIDKPHREGTVRLLDSVFPETKAVRQPISVARTRKQLEEEVGVVAYRHLPWTNLT
jgi:hypothetical protein